MSDRIKEIIGEELYNQVIAKGLKPSEFDMLKGFVPIARLNEVSGKLKLHEEKITEYQTQLESTKNLLKDNDDYKNKYASLQNDLTEKLKLKDIEIENTSKRYLLENELTTHGAKYTDLLMSKIDINNINIKDGFSGVIENLKKDYKDLFTTTQDTTPATPIVAKDTVFNNTQEDWGSILENIK